MSLAISVVQKDFVIACSDSAVTYFPYDIEKYDETGEVIRQGEMKKTNLKGEKVHKITNKVLLSTCGNAILTELFYVELSKRVRNDYDLNQCIIMARYVLNDLKQGKISAIEELIPRIQEKLDMPQIHRDELKYAELLIGNFFSRNITEEIENQTTDFTAYLVGFNFDGSSGMYDVRGNDYLPGPKELKDAYPALVDGEQPGSQEEFTEYQKSLILPLENRNLESFISVMASVHALISYRSNVNVSPDCNFHVLINPVDSDEVEYGSFTVDTSAYHDRIKESDAK